MKRLTTCTGCGMIVGRGNGRTQRCRCPGYIPGYIPGFTPATSTFNLTLADRLAGPMPCVSTSLAKLDGVRP